MRVGAGSDANAQVLGSGDVTRVARAGVQHGIAGKFVPSGWARRGGKSSASSVFPNDGKFNAANKNEVFGKDRCPIGYSPGHQGSANFLVMETNTPVRASDAREGSPSSPPCIRCASSETEPVVTMRRHTVDADPWYHCEECGHVFTTPRDE